ncbi:hypothetical protein [Salinibaculum salinum]|uniref:hypothetical protein n=1 Tax=Salinibaculum salinum TaxID=3131996 RepID=UPI0030EED89B
MTDRTHRVLAVLGLGVLGIALAWSGTALGIGDTIADGRETGKVDISGSNVTLESGNQQVDIVENITATDAVAVSTSDSRITITIDNRGPLTADEQQRARAIASENATVARTIEETANVTLAVEPIRKVNAESNIQFETTVEVPNNSSVEFDDGYTIESAENVTVQRSKSSVTVASKQPSASYVEDEAIVRVRDTATETTRYAVIVDLESETVLESIS